MEFTAVDILHHLKKYIFLCKSFVPKSKLSLNGRYVQSFNEFYRIEGLKNIKITQIRQDMRHKRNFTNKLEFDFVNNKKTFIFNINFYLHNKTIHRHFNSQNYNSLVENKRKLKEKFTPIIMQNLNNKIWPLDDPRIYKVVKNYIKLSNKLISILTAKKFQESFPLKIKNYKFWTENFQPWNYKHPRPFINRKKIKNKDHWFKILNESKLVMDCLLTKIWTVELVSILKNCETSKIDDISFLTVPRTIIFKSVALNVFHNFTKKLKYDISLSNGATNQSIQRKSINNLNFREIYKKYLKSKIGKMYIKTCKHLHQSIENDPLTYWFNLKSETLKNNLELKFKLLEFLKLFDIRKYSTNPIVQVFITKNNSKLTPLNIFTRAPLSSLFCDIISQLYAKTSFYSQNVLWVGYGNKTTRKSTE